MSEKSKGENYRGNESRGTSAARGYGYTWQRIRLAHLKREPLCRPCLAAGRVNGGAPSLPLHVDHIVPLADGGTNLQENLQTLCHEHHNQKTAAERNGKMWKPKGYDLDGNPLDPGHHWN